MVLSPMDDIKITLDTMNDYGNRNCTEYTSK